MTKLIKLAISILIPALLGFVFMFIFSLIVLKTSVPENLIPLFSIISVCLTSIISTAFNTMIYKFKGIYVALFSFLIVFLYKIITTIIIEGNLSFTGKGIVGILFTALFCFIGCIIGSNAKK